MSESHPVFKAQAFVALDSRLLVPLVALAARPCSSLSLSGPQFLVRKGNGNTTYVARLTVANASVAADGHLSAVLLQPGCGWAHPTAGAGQGPSGHCGCRAGAQWPLRVQGWASAATREPGALTWSWCPPQ